MTKHILQKARGGGQRFAKGVEDVEQQTNMHGKCVGKRVKKC